MSTQSQPVAITVDPAMVNGIIEKQIQAAIIANLDKTPDLIEKVVQVALRQKVDHNGNISNYCCDNKYDWIEVICQKSIRDVSISAAQQWVSDRVPEIAEEVRKQLNKNKSAIVRAFADSVQKGLTTGLYVNCTLKLETASK